MKRIIYQLACYLLITAFVPAAFCQTSSDVWDISQGGTIISTTSIIGLSDARDMFGGNFGSSGDTTTVFQEQEIGPTDYAHTVEWQSPNLITVSNFNLYLSSDTDGMRAIGSFKLYAWNGSGYQLIFASNNVPLYVGGKVISGTPAPITTSRWKAEFTQLEIGHSNGPRISELDGFGTIVPPLNVGSDGSDGVLNVASNTVIDLSQAVTGIWSTNNSANAGKGVYDPEKWAVVFKYSSINIAAGCSVTFSNHPSRAPVVWLVQSNVVINGSLSLDGRSHDRNYPSYTMPTEPGPGGFRGGANALGGHGAGFGPGSSQANLGGSASSYGGSYGNPQLQPLMGGSGGGAAEWGGEFSGPSGGGAILIGTGGTTIINGQITARAGQGFSTGGYAPSYVYAGHGAIRLIARQLQGNGAITAGLVRTEADLVSPQLILTPNTVAVPPGIFPAIWPPSTTPTVKVLGVDGQLAPADPRAGVLTSSDLSLQTNNPVDIILQSQNFPPSGAIILRVTPKFGNYFTVNASFVSGSFTQATWKATTTLPQGFCVLQAHAKSP